MGSISRILLVPILFLSSLQAYQDCRIKIKIDPIQRSIDARDISKDGADLALDGGSVSGGVLSGRTLSLDAAVPTDNASLDLHPSLVVKKVWRCDFYWPVRKRDVVVRYTLRASNGKEKGISNNDAFIPVKVETAKLRLRRRRTRVRGDVKFTFDLTSARATRAGDYTGVLTIEVYAK